jgi:hypothetical protein
VRLQIVERVYDALGRAKLEVYMRAVGFAGRAGEAKLLPLLHGVTDSDLDLTEVTVEAGPSIVVLKNDEQAIPATRIATGEEHFAVSYGPDGGTRWNTDIDSRRMPRPDALHDVTVGRPDETVRGRRRRLELGERE